MNEKNSGIVYSTEHGRMCPACGNPVDSCSCSKKTAAPPAGDGVVRVGRETKGRKGKGVTVVTGVPLAASDLAYLARELKKRCGVGGTAKNGVIEIQGDHREVVAEELKKRGWVVK